MHLLFCPWFRRLWRCWHLKLMKTIVGQSNIGGGCNEPCPSMRSKKGKTNRWKIVELVYSRRGTVSMSPFAAFKVEISPIMWSSTISLANKTRKKETGFLRACPYIQAFGPKRAQSHCYMAMQLRDDWTVATVFVLFCYLGEDIIKGNIISLVVAGTGCLHNY